ncbi:MAG TPA: aldo/keto reductase [Phycisphaerae bacterium]|nr:aldo/keto reductase [Phycisphaerae bacterium]
MKYRVLGKSGLRVSVIGMGTWQFGGEWAREYSPAEVTAIFRKALEVGVNFVDTAECYGDHTSEALIGAAVKELGARDRFIIATKFGHHFVSNFQRTEPRSPSDVEKQLEDTLWALQTDYVDLYQYHSWGDKEFASEGVRSVLEKAKAAGKIRHIGNSIRAAVDNTYQLDRAEEFHIETAQVVYNRLDRKAETLLFPICREKNIGVLARVPLASGFLTGKYKPGDRFPENDVRTKWQSKGMDERLAEVERIQQTEVPTGVPLGQWALAWCLRNPAVQCVIPGCKSPEQLEQNAGAAGLVES